MSNRSRFGDEVDSSVTYNLDIIGVDVSRVSAGWEVVSLTSDQESKLFRMVKSVIFRKAVPTTPSSGLSS
jgi:hypothetical protein